jgi:hypothetical protein
MLGGFWWEPGRGPLALSAILTMAFALPATASALTLTPGDVVAGTTHVTAASGPVTLGQEGGGCAPDRFFGVVTLKANSGAVTVQGEGLGEPNVFHGSLKVISNTGGVIVSDNEVASALTVKGNAAPVIDTPNVVEGKSKVQ